MPLSPATRLGPYEIISSIGAGGMGEVYRARDTRLGRDVAIKVLPEACAHDAERMARFEREAQVLASLNHPNIAAIYGLEESSDLRALVMEMVEGATLAERIAGRAMPLEEALPIAKQIAEGMEYAHERGIVHRDLKPSNVKLTEDGKVKVLDFGLAKALEAPAPPGNLSISPTLTIEGTRTGVILGTAAYMAPEQARGALVDKRADIFAFGVVLYEMLTGKQPFTGATVSDTLASVLKEEPSLHAVPSRMRMIVERCLRKDPRMRWRDIGDVRMAIEEGLAPLTPQAPPRTLPWAVTAVLAVALLASLAVPWRSTRPQSQPLMRLNVYLPDFEMRGMGANTILSPDGRRVVYTGRGADGISRLFTRALDQEQTVPLAGTEDGANPFFSPDGQFVGFFAGGKLKKTSFQGGSALALCDSPALRGGSWGEDGNIIAALNVGGGLARVPSGGGAVEPVTELKPERNERTHRWPQVLPGNQAVLFTVNTTTAGFDDASVEAQWLRTGERKTLLRGGYYGRFVPSGHLLYVRQGTLYAVPMDAKRLELTGPARPVTEEVASHVASGGAQIDVGGAGTLVYIREKASKQTMVWLDSTGHTQPLRKAPAEYLGTPRFSPDGNRLALTVMEGGNTDLWVYEWERDRLTRLTFAPGLDASPVWSPDGKSIVFMSTRHGGAANLYWMRADGAGEVVRLTESNNGQYPSSFSPDGKWLAFAEQNPQTNLDLWTLPLAEVESGHPKPGKPGPFLVTQYNEAWPVISPDGRWLAYESDESGNEEIYVRQFPGPGGKWRVSTGGGNLPVWSKKGRKLFYQSAEGIMVADYTTTDATFAANKPQLSAEKKSLGGFDLAPDFERFAVLQSEAPDQKAPTQVVFLLNFFDELRRLAPAVGK